MSDQEFYSDAEAARALGEGLMHLEADGDAAKWRGTSIPYWVQQENDQAVAKVRSAIRYLCTESGG